MTLRTRLACLSWVLVGLLTQGSYASAESIEAFLQQHCVDCHSADNPAYGVRLDQLTEYKPEQITLWTKVHQAIDSGKMPPEDAEQPTLHSKQSTLKWIKTQQQQNRGTTTRRLNRRELSAALQDLTGLKIDYASMLPADGKVNGFDTGADALQDASDSVSRTLVITRRAVDAIRFLEPPGEVLSADLKQEKHPKQELDRWRKELGYRVNLKGNDLKTKGVLLTPTWLNSRDRSSVEIPVPDGKPKGVARLTLVLSGFDTGKEMPAPHLIVQAADQDFGHVDIGGTFEKPETYSFDVQLDDIPVDRKGNVKISFKCLVEMPYEVKGFPNDTRTKPGEKVPPGTTLYRPLYDRKKIRDPLEQPVPYTLLQHVSFEPNHVAAWPPESWGVKVAPLTDSTESAQALLELWMQRAWRRPVTTSEVEHFLTLYHRLRSQQMTFDNALRATFQSVLMSAPFRYLASPADEDPVIAQYAIASRLSFMLTGGPPDETLLELARAGKLRSGKVLDDQVDRLLDSEQSRQFFRPFVYQWLEIGQPITIAMRLLKNQDFQFGRHLRNSMRDETAMYVRQMVIDNRPVRELVDSDWTMSNDILSHFYEREAVQGSQLRKVKIPKSDPRGGGILSHGGIQSMLTWMGDNWVIYRGAWTMRHILDAPPPPPPLEVPELDANAGENRGKTFRELLAQHQEDPNCAICHRSMDPIGFAFQNFDLSGRWRDVEHHQYVRNELDGKVEWYGKGDTRPVDTNGHLPNGEVFKTYPEFKRLLTEHYADDIMRGVMKKLVLYGTGKQPDIAALEQIDVIMQRTAKSGHPMRDALKALIQSPIFIDP